MKIKLNLLIVDDEYELRKSLISILNHQLPDNEFEIFEADNGRAAVELVKSTPLDLVLMDVRMPEMDGLEALKRIKEHQSKIFVCIMTAHSNLQDAVTAIKLGAYDYIAKPVEPEKLVNMVKKAIETREMVSSLAITKPIMDDDIDSEFVGGSRKMNEVFDLIYRLSHVDTTVLIRGENGTGKELVARAIHSSSPRKHGEFIAINCGAIPESLMESELFGHEKGSFTGAIERKIGKFQLANKGTLFLDEIAELKPDMQVKLLRVLQDKTFVPVGGNREIKTNARIIAATNRNLEKMIEEGTFREDLFYRLNVMPIFMPPLRDRLDDLPVLVEFFIRKFANIHRRNIESASEEVFDVFRQYDWPGNIRELENVIERAFIVENGNYITLSSLPENLVASANDQVRIPIARDYKGPLDFDRFKEETEKEFIIRALESNHGKINKTVAHANIPKNTLLRKIKKYGIDTKKIAHDTE